MSNLSHIMLLSQMAYHQGKNTFSLVGAKTHGKNSYYQYIVCVYFTLQTLCLDPV